MITTERFRVLAIALLATMPLAMLLADEPQQTELPDQPAAAADIAASEIDKLIEQMDADQFATRREASQRLQQLGKAAIPALQQAAVGDSREVTTRAFEILGHHFQSDDETTKAAAKAALEQIAGSNQAATARRAKDILNPPPPPQEQIAQAIRLAPGAFRIQVNAVAGRGVVRRMKVVNGAKELEVEENGQKVKISEDPQRGIEVEMTEKVDGKDVTKKYAAKNAEELKKNHPEGYKLYEKHNNPNQGNLQINGIQIFQQAIPVVPQAIPVPLQPADAAQARDRAMRRIASSQIRQAENLLQSTAQLLKQMKAGGNPDVGVGESLDRIEKIQEQLRDAKAKLEEPQNPQPDPAEKVEPENKPKIEAKPVVELPAQVEIEVQAE